MCLVLSGFHLDLPTVDCFSRTSSLAYTPLHFLGSPLHSQSLITGTNTELLVTFPLPTFRIR